MASPKHAAAPPEIVELYEKLVATCPGVERKGAANPYTAVNGNMFSYLPASGLMALRLPPGERERFLALCNTTLYEANGIVQKKYVTIPGDLLARTDELKPFFSTGYVYAKSLKPKPSKK